MTTVSRLETEKQKGRRKLIWGVGEREPLVKAKKDLFFCALRDVTVVVEEGRKKENKHEKDDHKQHRYETVNTNFYSDQESH